MIKPTLVVMAAGMGSRYGGLKQIDYVGPFNETIMDYSVYDAIRAGFGKIIFIINKEIHEVFEERIGSRIAKHIPVEYVTQRLDDVPDGFKIPAARVKPWGTGHAVYSCRNVINEPFAVINADDFYGAEAFIKIANFLSSSNDTNKYHFCMAGFLIENTLTENGYVSRGVCDISDDGFLIGITERTHIEKINNAIIYTEDNDNKEELSPGNVVSMNLWGFTPSILKEFKEYFIKFLEQAHEKSEFYLPYVVNELIRNGKADVKVLKTASKWYGVTYREDKEAVKSAILNLIHKGDYPERLWNNGL